MASNVHVCQECGKKYSCHMSLKHHRIVQHSPDYLTCKREKCQKRFPDSAVLDRHMKAHTSKLHSCNICGDRASNRLDLYAHLVTRHSATPSRCALCYLECSSWEMLKEHTENVHPGATSKLKEVANLFCNVHSSARSFPEEDFWVDVLLNQVRNGEDVRFEQNGSVAATNGAEPMGEGSHSARSQQNESKQIERRLEDLRLEQNESTATTNRTESIRRGALSACFKPEEVVVYQAEPLRCGSLRDNLMLQQLALRSAAVPTPLAVVQSSSSPSTVVFGRKLLFPPTTTQLRELNEQILAAQNSNRTSVEQQPADIPTVHDARNDELFLREHSTITSSRDESGTTVTTYACTTCGMKSDDRDDFIKAHKPHPQSKVAQKTEKKSKFPKRKQ